MNFVGKPIRVKVKEWYQIQKIWRLTWMIMSHHFFVVRRLKQELTYRLFVWSRTPKELYSARHWTLNNLLESVVKLENSNSVQRWSTYLVIWRFGKIPLSQGDFLVWIPSHTKNNQNGRKSNFLRVQKLHDHISQSRSGEKPFRYTVSRRNWWMLLKRIESWS